MNGVYSNTPHIPARWAKPRLYRTTVAHGPRWPRLVILRSTCGCVQGVGYVWRHQGFISVRRHGA